jgi:ABC-type glycerol-3-phosphate transport system permease component
MATSTATSTTVSSTQRATQLTFGQRRTISHIIIHTLLLLGVIIMMIPLVWTISTSLKSPSEVFIFPPTWLPKQLMWSNYVEAVNAIPFFQYLGNTVFITALSVIGKVASILLVAFAFARMRWWGRDFMFMLMLATMMLPPHITLIPQFILFKEIGWLNTFLPLIIPNFFGGPWLTFLVRQYLLTIPRDLDDAARIDGCSDWGVFSRIILPLSAPAVIIVVIFVFNSTWNEFLTPLIYLQSQDKYTLALGLRLFQGESATNWHLLMAASLLSMLPVIILFFSAQKYFMQGIVFTGVKQ